MAKSTAEMTQSNGEELYKQSLQYGHGRDGFALDIQKSISLLIQAANLEYPKALYTLWYYYQNGEILPRNVKTANKYMQRLKLLADYKKDAEARIWIGSILESYKKENSDDFAITAFEYYKLSSKQMSNDALYQVARCYEEGIGTELNEELSFKYYELAAQKGNTLAQINVAFCYLDGASTHSEKIQAFTWLKNIDKSNISCTMMEEIENHLAACYEKGVGTQMNLLKAFEHRRAAEQSIKTASEIEKQKTKEIEAAKKEYQDQLNKRVFEKDILSPKAFSPANKNAVSSPKN